MKNNKLLRGAALLLALAVLPLAALAQDAWDGDAVAKLQADMASGATNSRKLVEHFLARIDAIDKHGPSINSVIEVNPDALKIADELDAERAGRGPRGPMHGIPVLLKDNIDATPMVNSAGSLALANHRPTQDAFVTARLRAAGAVILGKTNLSEWANFRSVHATSGWSARGGLTRNPYVLDRSTCGSSSGTASAVSASLAAAGVGTETDGSIICPSSVTGLVGLKPTVGLVSRNGIIPISSSQDTAGPMTRSVADAAIMLAAMVGRDEGDRSTFHSVGRAVFDYPLHLNAEGLHGARIGVLRQKPGADADVDAAMEKAIATLRRAGAVVVDAQIPTEGQWDAAELEVLTWEFKAGLEHYLNTRQAPVRSLAAIIDFPMLSKMAGLSSTIGRCREPAALPERSEKNFLTIRSSSEWNVTTTSRPPGFKTCSAAKSACASSPSSSLTKTRSA